MKSKKNTTRNHLMPVRVATLLEQGSRRWQGQGEGAFPHIAGRHVNYCNHRGSPCGEFLKNKYNFCVIHQSRH